METLLNILIAAAVAVGLAFDTLGVVGILRFPDVYTRLHADTKATTFGTLFLTLGAALWAVKGWVMGGWEGGMLQQAVHTGIVAVVLAVTNATGSHAIARAAWHAGVKPKGAVCNALEAREGAAGAAAEAVETEAAAEAEAAAGEEDRKSVV